MEFKSIKTTVHYVKYIGKHLDLLDVYSKVKQAVSCSHMCIKIIQAPNFPSWRKTTKVGRE